jgi:hypothetical protein
VNRKNKKLIKIINIIAFYFTRETMLAKYSICSIKFGGLGSSFCDSNLIFLELTHEQNYGTNLLLDP